MRKPPLQDVIIKSRESSRRHERPSMRSYSDTDVLQPPRAETNSAYVRDDQQIDRMIQVQDTDHPPFRSRSARAGRTTVGMNRHWASMALGIGAIIILSSVALSLLFAGATVTVYPRHESMVINASILAHTEGAEGALPIERVVLERTAQRAVPALGEEEVEERASGKITIYNEFSDTPQRIIRRTRFKSNDGHIFRIDEGIEIPGKKPDGSPGTIEVTVRAEEPGEEYNVGPDTFSVPGYEGYPQEGLIYGKSTEAFSGGFKGIRRSVNEEERTKVMAELETQLKDELLAATSNGADIPEGYRLFKEGVFFEFVPQPESSSAEDSVTLTVQGKLHGILFPEELLAKRLAQMTISSYAGSPIRIDNMGELSVSVTPRSIEGEDQKLPWEVSSYDVLVQGKGYFIWEFDDKALANDLTGKDKEILELPKDTSILAAYPGIDRMEVSIRPFWKGSFPGTTEDIQVLTKLD